jgi:hypothetical protein
MEKARKADLEAGGAMEKMQRATVVFWGLASFSFGLVVSAFLVLM